MDPRRRDQVYPLSDYADTITEYNSYTLMLTNNGSVEDNFVKPRGRNWVVLQPEDLLRSLSGQYPTIYQLYEKTYFPPDKERDTRFIKFQTIMAILNVIAMTHATSMSKREFSELVINSPYHGPNYTTPWDYRELASI